MIDVAAGDHLEALALGQAGDDLFAPPAESDNADPNHVILLLCRPDNAGPAADAQHGDHRLAGKMNFDRSMTAGQ